RFVIGKAGRPDQNESVALLGRQLGQGGAELAVHGLRDLRRLCRQTFGAIVDGFEWPAPPATLRVELIAQDREEPCHHIRARLERVYICAAAQQRLLNEVFSLVAIPAQRNREGTKARYRGEHGLAAGCFGNHDLRSLTGEGCDMSQPCCFGNRSGSRSPANIGGPDCNGAGRTALDSLS